MPYSFAGGEKQFTPEELIDLRQKHIEPMKGTIQGAFKMAVDIDAHKELHKQVVSIINKVYYKWTGKAKLEVGPWK